MSRFIQLASFKRLLAKSVPNGLVIYIYLNYLLLRIGVEGVDFFLEAKYRHLLARGQISFRGLGLQIVLVKSIKP